MEFFPLLWLKLFQPSPSICGFWPLPAPTFILLLKHLHAGFCSRWDLSFAPSSFHVTPFSTHCCSSGRFVGLDRALESFFHLLRGLFPYTPIPIMHILALTQPLGSYFFILLIYLPFMDNTVSCLFTVLFDLLTLNLLPPSATFGRMLCSQSP